MNSNLLHCMKWNIYVPLLFPEPIEAIGTLNLLSYVLYQTGFSVNA
jgi:hypothetical protein